MYRGTTPTLTFHLPMETAALASAYITFSQSGEVKLEKQLSDCTRSEKKQPRNDTDTGGNAGF